MANNSQESQLIPLGPLETPLQEASGVWYTYLAIAYPHNTDYSGGVWHGSYIAWMEEARVECLKSIGVEFADLVVMGCDLPVVELAIRYHQSVRMGMKVAVKIRMAGILGVRINWDYQIQSVDGQELFVTARVTLVAVDREKGKIMRHLPATIKDALEKISGQIEG
jgi:acyl-CoA thioester hydrolase